MVDSLESLSPRPMSSRSCEAWENAGQVPESDKDLVLWEGGKLRNFLAGIGHSSQPTLRRPDVSKTLFAKSPLRDLAPYPRSTTSEKTLSTMLQEVSNNFGGKRRALVKDTWPVAHMTRIQVGPLGDHRTRPEDRTFALPYFATTQKDQETNERGYFKYLHMERGDSRLCFGGPCVPCIRGERTVDYEEGMSDPPSHNGFVNVAMGRGPKKAVLEVCMVESPASDPPHALVMLRRHRELSLFDVTWDGRQLLAERSVDHKLDPDTFYVLRWRDTPWLLAYLGGSRNKRLMFKTLPAENAAEPAA